MNIPGIRVHNYSGRDLLPPGGYAKDEAGLWWCRAPVDHYYFGGNLYDHKVEEHPDGTISVTPSLLITHWRGRWHGYLKKGVWEVLPDTEITNPKKEESSP